MDSNDSKGVVLKNVSPRKVWNRLEVENVVSIIRIVILG